MTSNIWAGEVGETKTLPNPDGSATSFEITGTAEVSEVDVKSKTIVVDKTQEAYDLLDGVSRKAVDQTGETVIDGIQFTEAEEAAGKFTYFLRSLKKETGGLSAKAAARVLHRIAEFPLGDTVEIDKMGFTSRKEKLLFQLFYEINLNKNVIIKEMKSQQKELEPTSGEKENGN